MAKQRRSPLAAELIKGLIFLGFGAALIVQPWLAAVSWLGWLIVAAGALIAVAMALRIRSARAMRRHVVAEFASGNAVYARGMKVNGVLYDFSTPGAQLDGASFDGGELRFLYSYYARRRGRASEVVGFAVPEEERGKAQDVIDRLGLPTVEAAQQRAAQREEALEQEQLQAGLERKDR